jgi:hypothetical protein
MTPRAIPIDQFPEPEPKVRPWTNRAPRKQPTARERGHSGPYVPWVAVRSVALDQEDEDR